MFPFYEFSMDEVWFVLHTMRERSYTPRDDQMRRTPSRGASRLFAETFSRERLAVYAYQRGTRMMRFRNLAVMTTLILGVLLTGTPAHAATPYPPPTPSPSPSQPGNTISVTIVTPGGTITITVTGFLPGETIIIVIHSTPVQLAAVKADASG